MKIKPYLNKLEGSKEYKQFKSKYPESFMTAGFFILDLETGRNVHQIDFYVPKEKKIAAFTLDKGVVFQMLDLVDMKMVPEKLDLSKSIDLDTLKGILTDEMRNRGMSEDIKKIIAVIQNIKGKKIWNLNCVLSGMELLNSHVEDDTSTVLRIERSSMMDLMKKINPKDLVKAPGKGDIKTELKNLDKLEAEIEKEKEKLKSGLSKKQGKQDKIGKSPKTKAEDIEESDSEDDNSEEGNNLESEDNEE